jgi:hypothetical protein
MLPARTVSCFGTAFVDDLQMAIVARLIGEPHTGDFYPEPSGNGRIFSSYCPGGSRLDDELVAEHGGP